MRLVTLAGIPIRVHWTLLVVALVWAAFTAVSAGVSGMLWQLLTFAAVFLVVVLHELGHAAAAAMYGIPTMSITLYPIGGVAAVTRMPDHPWEEFVVAFAGPAVNGVLFAAAAVGWWWTSSNALLVLMAINLVMGVFNLVPAFPMDGGRMLRAALAVMIGHVRASRAAMQIGRVIAALFFIVGVVTLRPSLTLVAVFLWFAIGMERRRLDAWLAAGRRTRPIARLFEHPLV
jgi:Zn-dependent protease